MPASIICVAKILCESHMEKTPKLHAAELHGKRIHALLLALANNKIVKVNFMCTTCMHNDITHVF